VVLASVEDHTPLFGDAAPDAVLDRLQKAAVAEIVVKFATPAVCVCADGRREVVQAEPVADVMDTTAAGDSFAAAYLAARLAGRAPHDAARAGHRLAGAVVRHRGAIIPAVAMPDMTGFVERG
jgi:2-dehydro-3-deoxygluconokinase